MYISSAQSLQLLRLLSQAPLHHLLRNHHRKYQLPVLLRHPQLPQLPRAVAAPPAVQQGFRPDGLTGDAMLIMQMGESSPTGKELVQQTQTKIALRHAKQQVFPLLGWSTEGKYLRSDLYNIIKLTRRAANVGAALLSTTVQVSSVVPLSSVNADALSLANVSDSQCSTNCAGNAAEKCGAGSRLSVYATGNLTVWPVPKTQTTDLPGKWEYKGCLS